MSFWRQLTRGLRKLRSRTASDQEVADEVNHCLDESTATFIARGLTPDEARRAARLELGSATAVREQVSSYGWENSVETFLADIRYAVRRLLSNPGFTAVSILTLALGMGATTAIFSVVDGVLLRPLPYPHSEQLVALRHTAPGINIKELNLAISLYFTYSEENRVFQDVGMWTGDSWTVTGPTNPEQVPGLSATHRFLNTLGVQPAIGRGFTASDEDLKSDRTVILSDSYWRSHFASDTGVLGKRLLLDGNAHTIIGVLPRSFRFMDRKISLLAPVRVNRSTVRLVSFCCQGVARLKPGVTLAQADADVARMLPLAAGKFSLNPGMAASVFHDARIAPTLLPLKDSLLGDAGNTLWVLMGTVGLVLLIACANVANLLLVRADGRRQELAVRAALGAGTGRIARELLLESLLLGLAGGALGLALAYAALRILVSSELTHLPRLQEIALDPFILLFTLGLSIAAGLLFGLVPVFRYARPRLSTGLRSSGRSLTADRGRHRTHGILVVVQVALALVLLVGSGLMIRTFQALRNADPGFSGATELETARIGIPDKQVPDADRVVLMEEQILRKIESVAGVSKVGIINSLPTDGGSNNPVYIEDREIRGGAVPPIRRYKFVSPGYFSAAGTRFIAGRDLTWAETYNKTPVALISENMARELWQDPRNALGKRIRFTLKDDWREIIGVVADLRDDGADQKAPSIVYWPLLEKNFFGSPNTWAARGVSYVVRTPRAGSTALLQDLQRAVASVNPGLPVSDVKTLDALFSQSLARTSFTLVLLAIAGCMALLLGVVGIYGVISYSVAQRTREIGIRLALGSPLKEIVSLFVRDGLVLAGIGTVCGLTAALAATRLMKAILYEVSPADPITYLCVSLGLILAAVLASYLPARRATSVDPVEALRAE